MLTLSSCSGWRGRDLPQRSAPLSRRLPRFTIHEIMMPMRGEIGQMLAKAQQMQEDMKRIQAELGQAEVTGESGAGMVRVRVSGRLEVLSIEIDRGRIGDDHELLEDLVTAAVNDALSRAQALAAERMREATAGLPLPPGFSPF